MTNSTGNGSEPQGFQFPGNFEITAVGPADAGLETTVLELLDGVGVDVAREKVRTRPSRAGRYISVTVECSCATRQHYEAAHEALRAHDDVRYTL